MNEIAWIVVEICCKWKTEVFPEKCVSFPLSQPHIPYVLELNPCLRGEKPPNNRESWHGS
jgi:hypothetical protein